MISTNEIDVLFVNNIVILKSFYEVFPSSFSLTFEINEGRHCFTFDWRGFLYLFIFLTNWSVKCMIYFIFSQLEGIVTQCVKFGESNSVLIIGPRGSGKTKVRFSYSLLFYLRLNLDKDIKYFRNKRNSKPYLWEVCLMFSFYFKMWFQSTV